MTEKDIYNLAKKIFPICRSITGNGVLETLEIIKKELPQLKIKYFETGTKVFDWEVPREWNIKDAYIEDSRGEKIIDFKENNLHVVGYSMPVDKHMTLSELKKIIYVEENQPEVIPYVTSYYTECSGFCMSKNQRDKLKEDTYHVYIDSSLKKGKMWYGELIVPGEEKNEILLTSYVCHPSMANNECSGPSVLTYLGKWIQERKRRYTYRIIFVPETIGTIAYLAHNLENMKQNVKAGFNLSCVGDERIYSFVSTKYGNSLSDRVMENVLKYRGNDYIKYSFLNRGSDEKQYNMPGIDIPVVAFCRSKYGEYPEYHTSADNMNFISPKGLNDSFETMKEVLLILEENYYYQNIILCNPQLGKRGLYPSISKKGNYTKELMAMLDFLAYADGTNDVLQISDYIDYSAYKLLDIIHRMEKERIVKRM